MPTVQTYLAGALAAVSLMACADSTPTATAPDTVTLEAGDLFFAPETLAVAAGEITIVLHNRGMAEHDVVIAELGDTLIVHANPGETATGTVRLEPGTYTYYCSIPGHKAAMTGVLTAR